MDRIAETVANAVIDMAKILVAASNAPVPQNYAAALRTLGQLGLVPGELVDRLIVLVELRHALAREYLDLKWPAIREFIEKGFEDVLELVTHVERQVVPSQPEKAGAEPGPAPAPPTGEG